jgi:hypothetical protein
MIEENVSKKRGPKPGEGGRKPFQPTAEQRKYVSQMAAVGIAQEQIARAIVDGGIAVETLQKYFNEELETASIKANAAIGGAAFKRAMSGDPTMLKWWTAVKMGWRDPGTTPVTNNVLQVQSEPGKTRISLVQSMSDEQLESFLRVIHDSSGGDKEGPLIEHEDD